MMIDVDLTSANAGTVSGSNPRRMRRASGAFEPIHDVAANDPQPLYFYLGPVEDDGERVIVPTAGVTNIGVETVGFPVIAAIGAAENADELSAWLLSGEGDPPALWHGFSEVEILEPADTVEVQFPAFEIPKEGGNFWFGFRAEMEDDEFTGNDSRELIFEVAPESEL